MPRLDSSSVGAGSSVEQERLLALVDTQKRHIDELRKQLQDTLEIQKQQQLQLVQQSPARRNVRKLLEKAAADNTALAKRVEEMRAQRNALCVTKAALTAQVSELIRMAADDLQQQEQHKLLQHQLSQLTRLIQHPHLHKPQEQMAAVVAHIKQLYRERQELTEKLQAAMRSSNNSSSSSTLKQQQQQQQQPSSQAAGVCPAPPSSPSAGLRLDQQATSQLIWTSSCTDLFRQQQKQRLLAATAGGPQSTTVSAAASSGTQPPAHTAAAAGAAGADASPGAESSGSFMNAQSGLLLDLSPLRATFNTINTNIDVASNSDSNHGAKHCSQATPSSRTPAPTGSAGQPGAAAAAAGGGGSGQLGLCCNLGTPLSAQSLSAFSSSGPTVEVTPSPRLRQALQLLSPARRAAHRMALATPRTAQAGQGTATTGVATTAAAAASIGLDADSSPISASSNSSSNSRLSESLSDLLTPVGGVDASQQHTPSATWVTAGSSHGLTPSRVTPRGSLVCGFDSNIDVTGSNSSSSKPSRVGLCLQPEFRLAAADSLWPSPAAVRSSRVTNATAAVAAAGSTLSSHMLWLPDFNTEDDADTDSSRAGSPDRDICPRVLADFEFLQAADEGDGSSSYAGDEPLTGSSCEAAAGCSTRKSRRSRVVLRAVVCLGVSLAAAVVGSSTRYSSRWVVMRQMQQAAADAACHTQQQVAAGWKQARRVAAGGVGRINELNADLS